MTPARASFGGGLRAEWIKVRTMRSTLFLVLGIVAFCAGLAALNGTSAGDDYAGLSAAERDVGAGKPESPEPIT